MLILFVSIVLLIVNGSALAVCLDDYWVDGNAIDLFLSVVFGINILINISVLAGVIVG